MTARERRLYTLGIKALARYSGQSVEQAMLGLLDDANRGVIRLSDD